jgi:hypothetical protein
LAACTDAAIAIRMKVEVCIAGSIGLDKRLVGNGRREVNYKEEKLGGAQLARSVNDLKRCEIIESEE